MKSGRLLWSPKRNANGARNPFYKSMRERDRHQHAWCASDPFEPGPVALENPFVGLKSMTEADADRFFGRNDEIAGLLDQLKLHRLVAVVADSGAGKSSLA
jgi:hypothetical protein